MITRNEKAKGLWWRLLATLPVLAILMIVNTKVTAQEMKIDKPITVEMGRFELYDDNGAPIQMKDTVIYNEDGSYVKCETSDDIDPATSESRKKMTVSTHNADGTLNDNMNLYWEVDGDVAQYSVEPFALTESLTEGLLTLVDSPVNDSVYSIVEEMPKFPGGENAMMKFISENVTYPQEARDKNISGRVFVSFVVEKDGSVNEVKVIRGVDKILDDEAVRVVKAMPKWTPGKQKGEAVRVNYNLPIFFKLSDGNETKANSLVGTIWEGTGTGTKGKVTYTWHSVLQFTSEKEGFMVEKLVSQKRNGKPVVEFEDVAMDFEYSFDGKKTGAITPKNPDGTYMDDLPPEGFVLSDDGKTIVFNFYTATEDTGIKYVTYKKR